ncbi:MAG: biotin--[Clostridia bacterium]|nr:biotin--[acetyl-CoA-carboxylase] ligase [Clostridia bacterium]
MTEAILERLLREESVSGEALSRELGVTRAAVWKQIERLRAMGVDVRAQGRGGYRLSALPDTLMAPVINKGLKTVWAGQAIRWLPETDSTNRVAREWAKEGAPHGALVVCDWQKAGRGRRGRTWETPPGEAVAMSVILRPQAHPSEVSLLSLAVALACCRAVEDVSGLESRIKWPNDVVCGGRKVSGILLEMDADEQTVHSVVAGVGINVHQKAFPEEIAKTAGALDPLSGRVLRRADVVRAFLARLEESEALRASGALMDAYLARSATVGRPVRVLAPSETFTGTAEAVTPAGALLVRREDGRLCEVLAGDVSVRGLMGYV